MVCMRMTITQHFVYLREKKILERKRVGRAWLWSMERREIGEEYGYCYGYGYGYGYGECGVLSVWSGEYGVCGDE